MCVRHEIIAVSCVGQGDHSCIMYVGREIIAVGCVGQEIIAVGCIGQKIFAVLCM